MTPLDPGLLAAVLAAPEDDAVRLIFADWLEDHGEPQRADFIRVQVEIAARLRLDQLGGVCEWDSHPACGCRPCVLWRRERELFDAHGQAFILPLARALDVSEEPGRHKGNRYAFIGSRTLTLRDGDHVGVEWRRGFVEAVDLTAAAWLAHADAILSQQPVRQVTLSTWPEMDWAGDPYMGDCRVCIKGRESTVHLGWVHQDGDPNDPWGHSYVPGLLASNWPLISFVLPAEFVPV